MTNYSLRHSSVVVRILIEKKPKNQATNKSLQTKKQMNLKRPQFVVGLRLYSVVRARLLSGYILLAKTRKWSFEP